MIAIVFLVMAIVLTLFIITIYIFFNRKPDCNCSKKVVRTYNEILDLTERNKRIITLIGAAKVNNDMKYVKELREEYNMNVDEISSKKRELEVLVKEEE